MMSSLRPILIALAVLITIGTVGVLRPGLATQSTTIPGRTPGADEWSLIAFELEGEVPARALLGGIRHDLLDRRLAARGISWEGFRLCTRDLVSRVSRQGSEDRSGIILADAFSRSAVDLPVEIQVQPEPAVRGPQLDFEIFDLVRRLLARLPSES